MKYFNLTGVPVTGVELVTSLPNELGDRLTECLSRGVEKDSVPLSSLMDSTGIGGFIIEPNTTPESTKFILRRVSQLRGTSTAFKLSDGKLVAIN